MDFYFIHILVCGIVVRMRFHADGSQCSSTVSCCDAFCSSRRWQTSEKRRRLVELMSSPEELSMLARLIQSFYFFPTTDCWFRPDLGASVSLNDGLDNRCSQMGWITWQGSSLAWRTGNVAGCNNKVILRRARLVPGATYRLVSWSLTSLFSTNTAISETMTYRLQHGLQLIVRV